MEDKVRLCVECRHFQNRPSLLERVGFQSRSYCAAPTALRNSAFALVKGESIHECESMRAVSYACGPSASWFVAKPEPVADVAAE